MEAPEVSPMVVEVCRHHYHHRQHLPHGVWYCAFSNRPTRQIVSATYLCAMAMTTVADAYNVIVCVVLFLFCFVCGVLQKWYSRWEAQ